MVVIKYQLPSDDSDASEMRGILCRAHISQSSDTNPLTTTPFNELLAKICQKAFDEGREYQKNQKA